MQASIDTNKQATYELKKDGDDINKKLKKRYFEFDKIKALLNKFLVQSKNSWPDKLD